jgi:hypothetical protein
MYVDQDRTVIHGTVVDLQARINVLLLTEGRSEVECVDAIVFLARAINESASLALPQAIAIVQQGAHSADAQL